MRRATGERERNIVLVEGAGEGEIPRDATKALSLFPL